MSVEFVMKAKRKSTTPYEDCVIEIPKGRLKKYPSELRTLFGVIVNEESLILVKMFGIEKDWHLWNMGQLNITNEYQRSYLPDFLFANYWDAYAYFTKLKVAGI